MRQNEKSGVEALGGEVHLGGRVRDTGSEFRINEAEEREEEKGH